MDSSHSYRTVVQGEASESDDEEQEEECFNEQVKSVVVDGEAPESDEEEINTNPNALKREFPHLRLGGSLTSYESVDDSPIVSTLTQKQAGRPKYDNVLNRKLWESNLSLCNNLNGLVSQTYLSAAKEITNCSQQLFRSHAMLQDVSHHMRLMTNDCFQLQDSVDTVTSCTLLPNILLPSKPPTPVPDASSSSSENVASASSTPAFPDAIVAAS